MPAAAVVIQTFGDFLGFNPHLHILISNGCFGKDGMFYASPASLDTEKIELIFRHKVLPMLKSMELISERIIGLISSCHHSESNIYCYSRISPHFKQSMENLA